MRELDAGKLRYFGTVTVHENELVDILDNCSETTAELLLVTTLEFKPAALGKAEGLLPVQVIFGQRFHVTGCLHRKFSLSNHLLQLFHLRQFNHRLRTLDLLCSCILRNCTLGSGAFLLRSDRLGLFTPDFFAHFIARLATALLGNALRQRKSLPVHLFQASEHASRVKRIERDSLDARLQSLLQGRQQAQQLLTAIRHGRMHTPYQIPCGAHVATPAFAIRSFLDTGQEQHVGPDFLQPFRHNRGEIPLRHQSVHYRGHPGSCRLGFRFTVGLINNPPLQFFRTLAFTQNKFTE